MTIQCELHHGTIEARDAVIVSEQSMRNHRPYSDAEPPTESEYVVCADCLAEELHPLPLAD